MPKLIGYHDLNANGWADFERIARENPDFAEKVLKQIAMKKQSNFGMLPEQKIIRKLPQDVES